MTEIAYNNQSFNMSSNEAARGVKIYHYGDCVVRFTAQATKSP